MNLVRASKDFARRALAGLGLHVSRQVPGHTRDSHLANILASTGTNCVLDVGAFKGDYVRELRSLGYRGRIISFEPVPRSFELLKAALVQDPAWTGVPLGLSSRAGTATIHTHASADFNSLLTLKSEAARAYQVNPEVTRDVTIELARLDAVLPALLAGLQNPRVFLKMDTQGHDLDVMEGATGIHTMLTGIQSELPAVRIYEGMPSMSKMLDRFSAYGFVPVGFYPVNTLVEKQVSPEFDVLFRAFDGHLVADSTPAAA